MSDRLDQIMRSEDLTNAVLARELGCSTNYISGIRNGVVPSMKLGVAICRRFSGRLTLADLGLDVPADVVSVEPKVAVG